MKKKLEVDSKVAEICGALIGDGWIESTEKGLYVAGHIQEEREYYDNHLAPLFSRTFIKVKPKEYPYWSVYGFHTYKTKVIKSIIALGIKKGKKVDIITFPDWIFSSKKLMIAALRGLFDTDGNFSCKKCYGKYDNDFRKRHHCQPRIEISSVSKRLIKQSFNILKILELNPERIKVRKRNKINKKWKTNYILRLNRLEDIKKWFETLNLSANPKHITKYEIWKKFKFCPSYTTLHERKRILSKKLDPFSYYK